MGSQHRLRSLTLTCFHATAAPTPAATQKQMVPHLEGEAKPTPPPTRFVFPGAATQAVRAVPTMVPHSGDGILQKAMAPPKQLTPLELHRIVAKLHTTPLPTTSIVKTEAPELECDTVRVTVPGNACASCVSVSGLYKSVGVDGNGQHVWAMPKLSGQVMRLFYTLAPGGRSHTLRHTVWRQRAPNAAAARANGQSAHRHATAERAAVPGTR